MRFERGKVPIRFFVRLQKYSSHVGVRVQKLKAKVLSVPLLPVSSLPSRGSSVAPILAPIGRVSQSYIIATFTFLHFTHEHACIRA